MAWDSARRSSLSIPEDRRQFIENYFKAAEDETNSDTEIITSNMLPDIQDYIDFPKSLLLTCGGNAGQMYTRPPKTSQDARTIWKQARLPKAAALITIETALLDWAVMYAILEIQDKKIGSIIWRPESGTVCRGKWEAFLRWILCAAMSGDSAAGGPNIMF